MTAVSLFCCLRIDHPADAGSRGRDRSPESRRSTGMGAPDEQHPQPCRGDHQDRDDLLLVEELQNQASIAQSEESECHFKVGFSAEGGGASQKINKK